MAPPSGCADDDGSITHAPDFRHGRRIGLAPARRDRRSKSRQELFRAGQKARAAFGPTGGEVIPLGRIRAAKQPASLRFFIAGVA
jgi:hypothetical protein